MLSARVFEKSGTFDDNLPSFQDYDLWIRVAKHYDFEFVDKPLVIKHQHSGSQVAKDLSPRMRGLELFLDKWGDVIKKEAGEQAFNSIRRKHLSGIYKNAIFNNLSASQRSEAMKYLNRLREIQTLSLKMLVKVLIALLGGTKLLNLARRISFHASHFVRK